jgi:hypothetical protein
MGAMTEGNTMLSVSSIASNRSVETSQISNPDTTVEIPLLGVPLGEECSFYIPVTRDERISDGQRHPESVWKWFEDQLFILSPGWTRDGIPTTGWYEHEDGSRCKDHSIKFTLALPQEKIDSLRQLLNRAAATFGQACVYLSVAGDAELIFAPPAANTYVDRRPESTPNASCAA